MKSQLKEKDWSFYGDFIEYFSKDLKKKSAILRIKVAHHLERSEAILQKYFL